MRVDCVRFASRPLRYSTRASTTDDVRNAILAEGCAAGAADALMPGFLRNVAEANATPSARPGRRLRDGPRAETRRISSLFAAETASGGFRVAD